MWASETHEWTILEKIQGLEKQVQLASAREMEVVAQRQTKVKKHAETTKWKAQVLEQSVKIVLFDQLLKN